MTSKPRPASKRQNSKSDTKMVVRQWRILNILGLREQGATVEELAAEFKTSEGTIQRDLEKDLPNAGRIGWC